MENKSYRASPTEIDGNLVFDMVKFLHDPIDWATKINNVLSENYGIKKCNAILAATENTDWEWAFGNLPNPDISESNYGLLVFNQMAYDSFRKEFISNSFLDIGKGMYLFLDCQENLSWEDSWGQTVFSKELYDWYKSSGFSGLTLSDSQKPIFGG